MKKQRNDLKAGLFILITFALAVGVVVRIKGSAVGASKVCAAQFKLTDDIGGLQIGDDVRLGGYKIGIIRDIRPEGLDGPDPRIVIDFTIPADYTLHQDAQIAVQTGLTGVTDLNIRSVGTGAPLGPGMALVGKGDPKTELFNTLGNVGPHLQSAVASLDTQTIPKVNSAIDSAGTLIRHADQKVEPVVARYDKVADGAAAAMGQVSDLLGDTKPDLRGTIKNLNITTGAIKEKLPGLFDQVSAAVTKIDGSLTTARAALIDVQATAANARDITSTLRSVIVDNHGKLDGMISSLKTTSDNLQEASIELRHSPWRLLYKPTPGETANMNLYDSAREFAQGAGSLTDAATALRDAMHDPRSDRAQIQKLIDQLDASFNHFHQVENKLWSTAK